MNFKTGDIIREMHDGYMIFHKVLGTNISANEYQLLVLYYKYDHAPKSHDYNNHKYYFSVDLINSMCRIATELEMILYA